MIRRTAFPCLALLAWLGACAPGTHILGSADRDASVVESGDPADEGVAARDVGIPTEAATPSEARDVFSPDRAAAEDLERETGGVEPGADGAQPDVDGAGGTSGQDTSQDRSEQAEALVMDTPPAMDLVLPADALLDGAALIDGPAICPLPGVFVGGTDHCYGSGDIGNLQWLVSSSNNSACLTTYDADTSFTVIWNDSGDVFAELGPVLDGTKSYSALGTVSAELTEHKSGTAVGYSHIGVHGWSTAPLREYYIVEDWFGGAPNLGGGKVATITVDGAFYDVYRRTQVGPSIVGPNQAFDQYFSVRQNPRSCGHISVTEHFSRWEALGLALGAIEGVKVFVAVGGGRGRIDFSTAMISIR